MRIMFFADQQLGPAGGKVDPESGLNGALVDRAKCARFCVEDGIKRGAQLVCSGGDLFDSPKPDPTSIDYARKVLRVADGAHVHTLIVRGNHDAAKAQNEKDALSTLGQMRGVTVAEGPCVEQAWQFQDGSGPAVCPSEAMRQRARVVLQVACLPWPSASLLLANEEYRKLDPGQLNQLVAEKVVDVLRGLAAQLVPDVPSVLLAHINIDVAEAGGMSRLMMLGGDWTVNLHELTALGFDAVLAGHVHKPQVLSEEPFVAYSGSPECITQGERGEQKSYLLLDIEPGHVTWEAIPTPFRKFVTIDLAGDAPMPPAEELAGAIVRVKARQGEDLSQVRAELEAAGIHELTVEMQAPEVARRREHELTAAMDVPAALREWAKQQTEVSTKALLIEQLVMEAQAVEMVMAGGDEG